MSEVTVLPSYASVQCVRDLCDPWIELWDGDEWGESMRALHGACQPDYGFDDDDCALFASRLVENLRAQKVWVDTEGVDYGFWEPDAVARTQAECRRLRDYWRKGGNLADWEPAITAANETLATMPGWMFGEGAS